MTMMYLSWQRGERWLVGIISIQDISVFDFPSIKQHMRNIVTCVNVMFVIQWLHLHTKKRNRLAQSRLNDMVFVKFNHALECRAKSKETDPILLQDIDESNERLMGRMEDDEDDDEAVFVGEDLT
ncbi:hypothetical protein F3Y22_tig00111833pilonHSYRG00058 [Hibiscus syriacus]|uniref:Uncharacterized protein n=1 Tax=Hibiscus syriacus TaxID=106335 RepID=A0A6A2Y828_HIBSY|nr:hypothetical protein F3Y22_tig00111833pilonHSYRG00058 [Hibiscus syriacus]